MTLAKRAQAAEPERSRPIGSAPLSYDYAGAAVELNCSESWLRDNIRDLPHSKLGQSVAFTAEHLALILQMHEVLPHVSPIPLKAAAALDIVPRGSSRAAQQFPELKPRGRSRRAAQT
ncbi:hypothetical protein OG948_21415 [Embleya sp. NBC_00888]|uniref:hypothetical protein n=1 Tax=Embleya sp. NBC_00888 TaxID=2975960 RepID=UPI00386B74A6|nr:hypothetical protein OG948_21415 [Embleya sp. NBC_00888]